MKLGKSIQGALSYNENKVGQGKADLILAAHFGGDVADLGFSSKLLRFQKLNQLTEKTKTNTLHLSLNFSPDDVLTVEVLQKIAVDYMDRIGFGNQPYLVYQHTDAGHPHLHVVATTIKSNGKPIYLHNIGKRKSEPARKAIEQGYGLVPAEGRRVSETISVSDMDLKPLFYGEPDIKRKIYNVVLSVLNSYCFSSFEEFNAILQHHHVMADRGAPGTRMHHHKGLLYSIVDKQGNKTGVPIKASAIYSKPILSAIEQRFAKNALRKIQSKIYTQRLISRAVDTSTDVEQFVSLLRSDNIRCYVDENDGTVEKLYFLNTARKTVFTHDELNLDIDKILGKNATSLLRRTNHQFEKTKTTGLLHELYPQPLPNLLGQLLRPENSYDDISPEFLKKKRKKRKR